MAGHHELVTDYGTDDAAVLFSKVANLPGIEQQNGDSYPRLYQLDKPSEERILLRTLEFALKKANSVEQALRMLNEATPIKENSQLILQHLAGIIDRERHFLRSGVTCTKHNVGMLGPSSAKLHTETKLQASPDSSGNLNHRTPSLRRILAVSEDAANAEPVLKRSKCSSSSEAEVISIPGEEDEEVENFDPAVRSNGTLVKVSAEHLQELAACLCYDFVAKWESCLLSETPISSVAFKKLFKKLRLPITVDTPIMRQRVSCLLKLLKCTPPTPPKLCKEDIELCKSNISAIESAALNFLETQDKYVEGILNKSENETLPALLCLKSPYDDALVAEAFNTVHDLLTTGRMSGCKNAKIACEKLKMSKTSWDNAREEKNLKIQRDTVRLAEIREAVLYVLEREKEEHLFPGHPTVYNAKHPFYYFYVIGIDPKCMSATTLEKFGRRLKYLVHPDSLPKECEESLQKAREEAFKIVNTAIGECRKELDSEMYRSRGNWVIPPAPPYLAELKLDKLGMEYAKPSAKFHSSANFVHTGHKSQSTNESDEIPLDSNAIPRRPPYSPTSNSIPVEPSKWINFLPIFDVECVDDNSGTIKITVLPKHFREVLEARNVYIYVLRPTYDTSAPPSTLPPKACKVCSTTIESIDISSSTASTFVKDRCIQPWVYGQPKKYWIGVQFIYALKQGVISASYIAWKDIEITLSSSSNKKCIISLLETFLDSEFVNQMELRNVLLSSEARPQNELKRILKRYTKLGREWAEHI